MIEAPQPRRPGQVLEFLNASAFDPNETTFQLFGNQTHRSESFNSLLSSKNATPEPSDSNHIFGGNQTQFEPSDSLLYSPFSSASLDNIGKGGVNSVPPGMGSMDENLMDGNNDHMKPHSSIDMTQSRFVGSGSSVGGLTGLGFGGGSSQGNVVGFNQQSGLDLDLSLYDVRAQGFNRPASTPADSFRHPGLSLGFSQSFSDQPPQHVSSLLDSSLYLNTNKLHKSHSASSFQPNRNNNTQNFTQQMHKLSGCGNPLMGSLPSYTQPSNTTTWPGHYIPVLADHSHLAIHAASLGLQSHDRPTAMEMMRVASPSFRQVGPKNIKPGGPSSQSATLGQCMSSASQEETIEDVVIRNCFAILEDAASHSLKAVELANTLRARIGTEILADVRERCGGLLALLEHQPDIFIVRRIPKNDFVCLINSEEGNNIRSMELATGYAKGGLDDMPSPGSEGQVSRCLHVGNVPANLTEAQLYVEFERFGELEGLKVVTQRSRRFAFVTFATIEQAVAAKQRITKLAPWKSAISFAHKESIAAAHLSGIGSGQTSPVSQGVRTLTPPMPSSAPLRHNQQMHQQQHHLQQEQNQQHQNQHVNHHSNPYSQQHQGQQWSSQGGVMHGRSSYSPTAQYEEYTTSMQSMRGYEEPNYAPREATQTHHGQQGQHCQQVKHGLNGLHGQCPILQKLCDDTYTPSCPWPADYVADMPFVSACVAQLQQFGGSTSVSKLRGFLRNRIAASDNVKSVPLKALLAAYPHLFELRGNHVSLVYSSQSSSHPQTYSHSHY